MAPKGVWTLLLAGGAIIGAALLVDSISPASVASCTPVPGPSATAKKPPAGGWPLYTADDVAKHATADKGIWVTYRDGVYDITDFVASHPGGAGKIMLGAGSAIDPFWALYRQHDHQSVRDILAEHRIGSLKGYEASKQPALTDPYANDPKRHPAMRVSNPAPFNAEPPLDILADNFITPNELFFVRNHLPVPQISAEGFKLRVGGEGLPERSYTIDELRTLFPARSLTATIQCAGNRRSEMNQVKQVKGLGWGQAAISTATFSGVRLKDVLRSQGLNLEDPEGVGANHVHFKGLDQDATGMRYEASVPISKVIDGSSDVLLAWEMNGAPLPRDHGFPLRVVIPGVVGARQVKWLGEVRTARNESEGHWQQNDYKGFSPNIDWDNVDFRSAPAIQELPVTSAISIPSANTVLPASADSVKVAGYAWSGGGRGIVRVDVSADGGAHWHTATLTPKPATVEPQSLTKSWAWQPWTIEVPLDEAARAKAAASKEPLTLVCKAVDSSYNNQPESNAPIWNLRGCLTNGWHKVPIKIEDSKKKLQL